MTSSVPEVMGTATWAEASAPGVGLSQSRTPPGQRTGTWDFVELEAMNRDLGAAGERTVLARERAFLERAGEHSLAARVEHVSHTVGDGLGFDIRSFEPGGGEKLIEVKTTRQGMHWPMLVSRNEVEVSAVERERYHLYRLFGFGPEAVSFYTLRADLSIDCELAPETYKALPAV